MHVQRPLVLYVEPEKGLKKWPFPSTILLPLDPHKNNALTWWPPAPKRETDTRYTGSQYTTQHTPRHSTTHHRQGNCWLVWPRLNNVGARPFPFSHPLERQKADRTKLGVVMREFWKPRPENAHICRLFIGGDCLNALCWALCEHSRHKHEECVLTQQGRTGANQASGFLLFDTWRWNLHEQCHSRGNLCLLRCLSKLTGVVARGGTWRPVLGEAAEGELNAFVQTWKSTTKESRKTVHAVEWQSKLE